MAIRLSIRWQLALVSVALALLPIAVVGFAGYRTARAALQERISFNLQTLASQSDEKLERLLLDRQQNLTVWSQLGFMRDDAVTSDTDGRILQFLQEAKKNADLTQEFWVASGAGTVIASTLPALRGREVGDREWMAAARRGEVWVGNPEMQDLTGRVGMPMAVPLRATFDRSKVVGVIVQVLDWPKVVELLHGVQVVPEGQDERGYLLLVDSRAAILAAPRFVAGWESGRTRLSTLGLEGLDRIVNTTSGSGMLAVRDSEYLVGFATSGGKKPYLPDIWRTVLLMRTDVAFAPLRQLLLTIVLLSVVIASLAAAAAVYWATQFSRPIAALVPFLRSVAGGDLSKGFTVDRHDELGMLGNAANDMAAQLRSLLQDLQQASAQITGASTQVLTAAEDHASGSIEQAASIAQVTATMEELTTTAKQIAMSATSVEKIADDSAQAAHAGYDSVGEALEAMEKIRRRVADISGKTLLLGERSQRISEVLNLIKDIAGEIHLLAVNAAIESAAAGEHGKRFAVVAGEVRRLAERTRESAEEIKSIVGEIQSATNTSVLATEQGVKEVENGVSLATRARGSLEEIIQMVDRTTQAIRQITFATQQQQSASEQIVQTMREVAEVTRQAAAGMKQSANSVGELNVLADQFKTRIREFKL
ncbi:MAG: methyl-accepting chemotaxis protein [Vicinamibacterales bacterium]|nr:methyl-accepting chemotaxis protein [Vicinamibacterales bacterium]